MPYIGGSAECCVVGFQLDLSLKGGGLTRVKGALFLGSGRKENRIE
tara:strand:- start:189 stop:326 length:138 start_codon:yes stop_codon:yes gene_type:complete